MNSFFVLTLSDIIGILAALLVVACCAIFLFVILFKQARCKHDGSIGETSSCHAICHKCGKDLGFIDSWRNRSTK